jgi:Tol biopolymer transport system component
MILRTRVTAALALCALAAACTDPAAPDEQNADRLLLVSAPATAAHADWDTMKKDIYRMRADGTERENLTHLPMEYYGSLTLSPSGTSVAFLSNRDGCYGIWSMNVDGTGLQKLTAGAFSTVRCNKFPRWSPDGQSIAFQTSREGRWSVYVMAADGSNPRNVSTPIDQDASSISYPARWSPDGRVVFDHVVGSVRQAYIVNRDGTALGMLFGRTGDYFPAWSPDRSKVAFLRDVDGFPTLFVASADGSGARRLTNHPGTDWLDSGWLDDNDRDPWSPDGTMIAFINDLNGLAAVDVARVDGTAQLHLTPHAAETAFNGWSPDGRVTYTAVSAGFSDIYLINADKSGLVKLTSSSAHDRNAIWLPRR